MKEKKEKNYKKLYFLTLGIFLIWLLFTVLILIGANNYIDTLIGVITQLKQQLSVCICPTI